MANQLNYNTNVPNLSVANTKFMVSRILDNETSSLLEMQIPAELSDISYVEISLYSLFDNSLAYFNTFPSTIPGFLTVKTLAYEDQSFRKLLFIDFSKTDIQLVEGRYQAVFTFFAEEIGTADTAPLFIKTISPSRREVELKLLPDNTTDENIKKLIHFSSPQINTIWALDVIRQIFNQSGSSNANIPTDNTQLTFEIITSSLPPLTSNLLSNENTPSQFINKTKQQTQLLLDSAYGHASQSIATQKTSGSVRFTEDKLNDIISSSISYAINQYVQVSEFTFI